MNDDRKSPTDLIATHRYRPQDHCTIAYRSHCGCGWSRDLVGTHKSEVALHAEHVLEALSAEKYTVVDMLNDGGRMWVDSATFNEMMSDDDSAPPPKLLAAVAKARRRFVRVDEGRAEAMKRHPAGKGITR